MKGCWFSFASLQFDIEFLFKISSALKNKFQSVFKLTKSKPLNFTFQWNRRHFCDTEPSPGNKLFDSLKEDNSENHSRKQLNKQEVIEHWTLKYNPQPDGWNIQQLYDVQ